MASLSKLSSPLASTNSSTFFDHRLLTTASATTTTVAEIVPEQSTDGTRSRRSYRPTSLPSTRCSSAARRNERERNRVRKVNMGFATLKQHVPNRSLKMSKVDILRSAVRYIRQLQALLNETSAMDSKGCCNSGGVLAFAEAFPRTQPRLETSVSASASHSTTGASANSSAPSLGSDASSLYDSLSPDDEELRDFTTWLNAQVSVQYLSNKTT